MEPGQLSDPVKSQSLAHHPNSNEKAAKSSAARPNSRSVVRYVEQKAHATCWSSCTTGPRSSVADAGAAAAQ